MSNTAQATPKKVAVKKKDFVKVKNIHSRTVCTSKGVIEVGKTGQATPAELLTLGKYLEEV